MRINNNIFIVASCLLSLCGFPTQAASSVQGWGQVNMQGSIIDTACSITVESREQTIEMEMVPLADIIRNGHGYSRPFSIGLVNCIVERSNNEGRRQFQVTFDGDTDGGLFGVHGNVSGIGLQISDPQGNIAIPGKPLPLIDVLSGEMKLTYTLRLVANNHKLKAGDYFSSIRFKLDYF